MELDETKRMKPEALIKEKMLSKFPISELRKNCVVLFGVTRSTFDGATFGKTGIYTIDEMKDHINKWGEREVK